LNKKGLNNIKKDHERLYYRNATLNGMKSTALFEARASGNFIGSDKVTKLIHPHPKELTVKRAYKLITDTSVNINQEIRLDVEYRETKTSDVFGIIKDDNYNLIFGKYLVRRSNSMPK
jgi:hypothetical protein